MGRWKERRVVGALELVNKEEGIVVADRQKRNEIRLYFSLLLDIPSSTREGISFTREGELNCLSPWTRRSRDYWYAVLR